MNVHPNLGIRPPKPRYTTVWDVEQVLRQLKKFPDYKEMTPKQVTLEVTMLLALTSITEFMVKIEGTHEFQLENKVKHSKQGESTSTSYFSSF